MELGLKLSVFIGIISTTNGETNIFFLLVFTIKLQVRLG